MTVTLRPATTSVALRGAPLFAATVNDAPAGPVRVPPETLIHDGAPLTVHTQPAAVVTDRVPARPDEVADTAVGVTV